MLNSILYGIVLQYELYRHELLFKQFKVLGRNIAIYTIQRRLLTELSRNFFTSLLLLSLWQLLRLYCASSISVCILFLRSMARCSAFDSWSSRQSRFLRWPTLMFFSFSSLSTKALRLEASLTFCRLEGFSSSLSFLFKSFTCKTWC